MNTTNITATELKNNVSEIIDKVRLHNTVAIVKKYGRSVVKIIPFTEHINKVDAKKIIVRTYASLPDFPDVTKTRKSRKRNSKL